MPYSYFEHNAGQVEFLVADGAPADLVEVVTMEEDRVHPTKCRCRDCADAYGDWLYHSRLDKSQD